MTPLSLFISMFSHLPFAEFNSFKSSQSIDTTRTATPYHGGGLSVVKTITPPYLAWSIHTRSSMAGSKSSTCHLRRPLPSSAHSRQQRHSLSESSAENRVKVTHISNPLSPRVPAKECGQSHRFPDIPQSPMATLGSQPRSPPDPSHQLLPICPFLQE